MHSKAIIDNKLNDLTNMVIKRYQELMETQDKIRKESTKLKSMSFGIISEDEEVRHMEDNHKLLEKYKFYLKKYNTTATMLNKVSTFIKNINNDFIIDFEVDKESYTVAAIAPYVSVVGVESKVYLWKSIYTEPDYIKYILTPMGDCKILKIYSQQPPVGHKSFMFEILKKAVGKYNNVIIRDKFESVVDVRQVISRIVADLSENNEQEKTSFFNFFRKKGFEFTDSGVYKLVSKG